jgi:hypothetical protein
VARFLIDANLPYRWDVWGGDQFQHVFDLEDDLIVHHKLVIVLPNSIESIA